MTSKYCKLKDLSLQLSWKLLLRSPLKWILSSFCVLKSTSVQASLYMHLVVYGLCIVVKCD